MEASFYKPDSKSSSNLKSKGSSSNENMYSEHFDQIDFINSGRDFAMALVISSTNTVLKNIFYPILLLSPLTYDEKKVVLKSKSIKRAKKKSKLVIRDTVNNTNLLHEKSLK